MVSNGPFMSTMIRSKGLVALFLAFCLWGWALDLAILQLEHKSWKSLSDKLGNDSPEV
jgi:hypothetical protein